MKIHVFPLDFMGQAPLFEPVNRKLHDMAVDFAKRELAEEIDFSRLAKVWVAAKVDEKFEPTEIVGLTGYVLKPDIPLFRVVGDYSDRATMMLRDRLHSFFADQGISGKEVFVFISSKETPEQRCNKWEESLKAAGATPADRYSVIVR